MVTIWFEPHALTDDNEAKRVSGWNDVDLSDRGLEQAIGLVERSRRRNISAIFCSDLQRAVKTVVPTANALHIPIYPDERLRECNYGDMTGESSVLIEKDRTKYIDRPFPGGESYRHCLARMESFFDDIRHAYDGEHVLIIGHRATHYGIEVFGIGKTLETCMADVEHWRGKSSWKYEIV